MDIHCNSDEPLSTVFGRNPNQPTIPTGDKFVEPTKHFHPARDARSSNSRATTRTVFDERDEVRSVSESDHLSPA